MGGEVAAPAEVEHDGARHDRHHLTGGAHRQADPVVEEPTHHPVGGTETEGATAREHHGVHAVDHVARVEQVGLTGSGAAAAHVDTGHSTAGWSEHHCRSGEPAVTPAARLPDLQPGDIREAVGGSGPYRHALVSVVRSWAVVPDSARRSVGIAAMSWRVYACWGSS